MTKTLTEPTWLYNAKEAPAGRLFDASEDRPIDHPGAGWVDSPPDLEAVAQANDAGATEDAATIAELQTKVADQAEEIARLTQNLDGVKETAATVIDGLRDDLDAATKRAEEAEAAHGDAVARATAAEAQVAAFDKDGDGKAGGSKPKAT